jgi:tripartite-type tricarboxylate transporter receptor subunit TctC
VSRRISIRDFEMEDIVKLPRRQFLHLAAGAAVLPAVSRIARGQTYPRRPITMIVPFAPGGATDTLARVMAERMKISLGQPIVIENVTGANGTIGVGRTARAAPDGYTIDMGQFGSHVVPGAMTNLRYDAEHDFEPIGALVGIPLVLYAKKTMPGNDLQELVAWLKANPGKASHGNVSFAGHAVGALFQRETGTQFQFVPYRGEGAAVQDLLAGHIDLMWGSTTNLVHVHSRGIKAYMATTEDRLSIAPNIPTAAEVGLPTFTFSFWWGMFAPKGTPKSVVERLNGAAMEALADSAARQRLADIGMDIFPPSQQTPEWLGMLVKSDIEKWWPVIKAAGIKDE